MSAARAAAFGATPDRIPRRAGSAEERWLIAVALGGQGHYAAAAAELARLAADRTVPLRIAAHAAVTRAAHLRQLGGHAAARPYDARALRLATAALSAPAVPASRVGGATLHGGGPARPHIGRSALHSGPARSHIAAGCPCCDSIGGGCSCCDGAPGAGGAWGVGGAPGAGGAPGVGAGGVPDDGLDAAAARIDALVGLAADAVGLGDPATTERLLAVAAPALAAHSSWRPVTRAGWVRAELALVRGQAAEAVAPAAAALTAAHRGGSLRHVLKSRIVLAVARGAADELAPTVAVTELDAAAAECARAGLLPLCWPAGLAALDLAEIRINDQVASSTGSALGGRSDGATRRRHAIRATLNVIEQRSDGACKRQMGESVRILRSATLV